MALPQLNTATYELELPSSKETIKFRPFLVKEQKILMIAQESEDEKQIENAFATIIKECTFGAIEPYSVPLFDVEYIFLQLRGKAVGDKITLNVLCPDDEETRVDVKIDLEEIGILMDEKHSREIDLTDSIRLIMKYPTLSDMSGFTDKGVVLSVFEMIKNCIYEIHNGEEIYNAVDISKKELDAFIDQMSTKNFDDVNAFFDTMPKLQHVVKVKNPKTKKTGDVTIEGIQSFFE